VPLNGTVRLQMSNKQPIHKVVNPKENAVAIRSIPGDPTTVLLIGQEPDVTRIQLTDFDGRTESYEVIVQADVEHLRTQLRRAVPTANVVPIPTSNNTVILSGTVPRAEDVHVLMSVVQGAGFQAVNALRVGSVQEVQLDVVIAQMGPGLPRKVVRSFLDRTGNQTAKEPTNLLFGIIQNRSCFLGVLDALREENLVKVIAEPRLVTLSGRPASFLSGGEQAVPVTDGSGKVGVQFNEFGTRINFLPIVLGNGKIHLEVEPEVSLPGRTTSRINTTLELESGQTFVIGGPIQNIVQASALKVPILGDLPVMGPLFTTKTFREEEIETIFLVTPFLVNPTPGDQTAAPSPQEPRSPPAAKLNPPDSEGSPRTETAEPLRRLERRLQRLREEIDDLQREVHSLRGGDRDPSRQP
jgi:pilus assembly protein CpaC